MEQAVPERLEIVATLEQEARELRARDQFIKSIVDNSRDCIKVIDLDARLMFMNDGGMAALELFDFNTVRGANWLEFWRGADRIAATKAFEAARDGHNSQFVGFFETVLRKRPCWWHVVLSPIYDDAGNVKRVLVVSRDVSDRHRLEVDLRTSIEARDEFLSIASHELRTPVTSLQLQLDMARAKLAETGTLPAENLTRLLDVAARQVQRLTKLVDSMLGVSAIHAGKLPIHREPADLNAIVSGVYDRLRDQFTANGSTVALELADDVRGSWDLERLDEIVENLLINAIKYAPGVPVTLTTRCLDTAAQLVVADCGPGIPHDKRDAIFERFERVASARTVGGLGLGLFIVKQLVEAHHGHVHVRPTDGGGATFVVELPFAPIVQSDVTPDDRNA